MRFHKLEEDLRRAGARYSGLPALADILRDSQKFYAGTTKYLPQGDVLVLMDYPKIPFELSAFEFDIDFGGEFGSRLDRLFCICRQYPNKMLAFVIYTSSPMRDGRDCIPIGEFEVCNDGLIHLNGLRKQHHEKLSEMTLLQLNVDSRDHTTDKLLLAASIQLAIFLRVLNCVNVKTETVDAPAALNKKRTKSGKPPIYSYKVLVLRPSVAQRMDHGGTHESPRIHLRHGHIKRRNTGNFWWQPHVVGDRTRGVVMKDYRADELVSE